MSSSPDIVAAVPFPRVAWERASAPDAEPGSRELLQARVGDGLLEAAGKRAATAGLLLDELVAVDTRPADEAEEVELLGLAVNEDPAAWMVVRGRFTTRPIRKTDVDDGVVEANVTRLDR